MVEYIRSGVQNTIKENNNNNNNESSSVVGTTGLLEWGHGFDLQLRVPIIIDAGWF